MYVTLITAQTCDSKELEHLRANIVDLECLKLTQEVDFNITEQ